LLRRDTATCCERLASFQKACEQAECGELWAAQPDGGGQHVHRHRRALDYCRRTVPTRLAAWWAAAAPRRGGGCACGAGRARRLASHASPPIARASGARPRSHETDRKILKSAQQGYQNPLRPWKAISSSRNRAPAATAGSVSPPTAPFRTPQRAEVPVRRRDVRGVRLGPVAANPPSRHIHAWW
jgi:hypothetical protein